MLACMLSVKSNHHSLPNLNRDSWAHVFSSEVRTTGYGFLMNVFIENLVSGSRNFVFPFWNPVYSAQVQIHNHGN